MKLLKINWLKGLSVILIVHGAIAESQLRVIAGFGLLFISLTKLRFEMPLDINSQQKGLEQEVGSQNPPYNKKSVYADNPTADIIKGEKKE